jgi:PAS domain S-box-containing protein
VSASLALLAEPRVDAEALLRALPEALCIVDGRERVAHWSAGAEMLLGHEAIDVIGEPVDRILVPGRKDEHEDLLATLAQGSVVRERLTENVKSDGRTVHTLMTAFPLRDEQGQPSGYGLLFREVAPMSEAQSKIALKARVESLARLVAGVAHEINNPCGFVLANVQHVRRGLETLPGPVPGLPDDAIDALRDAEEGTVRIRDLVASMRVFSRGNDFPCSSFDMRDLVDEVQAMALKDVAYRASLRTDRGPRCTVQGERMWLGQVLHSLIVNAADAFAEDDPIGNRISVYWDVAGDRVTLHVADNGPGIDSAVLEHIFDPFYTTKAPNRGVGLGLSICHDIVTRHGGQISARSDPGRGTEFRVALPLATSEAGAGRGPAIEA